MLKLTATTASKSVANDYGWQFARNHPDVATRFVRGGKMPTLPAAFSEFAAALQFPWYFGENMAALVDCLGDLSWLADNVLIIVYDADLVLADAEDDKPSFYGALRRAAEAFSEASNPLHPDRTSPALFQFLLQCDLDKLDRVKTDARLLGGSCEMIDAEATEAGGA
jgi:hypothetical protein